MAVSVFTYTKLLSSLCAGEANLPSDTFKVMLLSAYTVGTTQDDAQYLADVLAVATQTTGSGYTAGGQALTGVTWTQTGHQFALDCDDPTWDPSSISAAFALFYDSTPATDATRPLLCCWDFGGTAGPSVADAFTLPISTSGLLIGAVV